MTTRMSCGHFSVRPICIYIRDDGCAKGQASSWARRFWHDTFSDWCRSARKGIYKIGCRFKENMAAWRSRICIVYTCLVCNYKARVEAMDLVDYGWLMWMMVWVRANVWPRRKHDKCCLQLHVSALWCALKVVFEKSNSNPMEQHISTQYMLCKVRKNRTTPNTKITIKYILSQCSCIAKRLYIATHIIIIIIKPESSRAIIIIGARPQTATQRCSFNLSELRLAGKYIQSKAIAKSILVEGWMQQCFWICICQTSLEFDGGWGKIVVLTYVLNTQSLANTIRFLHGIAAVHLLCDFKLQRTPQSQRTHSRAPSCKFVAHSPRPLLNQIGVDITICVRAMTITHHTRVFHCAPSDAIYSTRTGLCAACIDLNYWLSFICHIHERQKCAWSSSIYIAWRARELKRR